MVWDNIWITFWAYWVKKGNIKHFFKCWNDASNNPLVSPRKINIQRTRKIVNDIRKNEMHAYTFICTDTYLTNKFYEPYDVFLFLSDDVQGFFFQIRGISALYCSLEDCKYFSRLGITICYWFIIQLNQKPCQILLCLKKLVKIKWICVVLKKCRNKFKTTCIKKTLL